MLSCSPVSFPLISAYLTSTHPSSPPPQPVLFSSPFHLPHLYLSRCPLFHLPFTSPLRPQPVLPHSLCSQPASCTSLPPPPPRHPSYTLVFFCKLSDLFHMILPSQLASWAHGILSTLYSLAARGPDATISLSLPLSQLPLLPSQNKSKAAQALGAVDHECSHFSRNHIPFQASMGTSLSPSAKLPLCEAGSSDSMGK